MKIDTKKCTSIIIGSPDNRNNDDTVLFNQNKFIITPKKLESTIITTNPTIDSSSSSSDADADDDHDKNDREVKEKEETTNCENGRTIKYIPTIIYTPVQVSKRLDKNRKSQKHHQQQQSRLLLTSNDVDELNHKLETILKIVDDGDDNDDHKEDDKNDSDDEEKNQTKETVDEPRKNQDSSSSSSLWGRFYTTIFSYRTCTTLEVMRSARLVKTEL